MKGAAENRDLSGDLWVTHSELEREDGARVGEPRVRVCCGYG